MRHPRNASRRVTGLACAAAIAATAGISTTALAHADSTPHDASAPAAPPTDGTAERIEFAPGTDNATVSGGVARGERHRYVLWAAEGQNLWAEIASPEENAVITIYSPDGTALPGGETGYFGGGTLPASGDYIVDVSSLRGNAAYTLFVRVTDGEPSDDPTGTTERIEFAPGTNNASVAGAIVRGTSDRYLLWAAAGQTMVAHVDSIEANAVFHVYAPDGTALAVEQQQATVELPASGTFVVEVASTRGNATYRMSVWIDDVGPGDGSAPAERIEFAPGTNNGSVAGDVLPATTDRYLLWAAAGQTMVAHVDSVTDNVHLSIYAPDGTPLAENLEQATVDLPINGDYLVAISTTSSGGPYQLSVWIE